MKKILTAAFILSLLFIAEYCKKGGSLPSNNNSNNNSNDTTHPSAVGNPSGVSISRFIPASGGSISTDDGRIEIDIPAGALPNGDTITIQNISNDTETGIGDVYRFLPNGLKFASAVTIKFHYTDDEINGTLPDLLGIAYQDSAHFWKAIQPITLDSVARIISVQTSHFTDYMAFVYLQIVPVTGSLIQPGNKLMINKSETFKVNSALPQNAGEAIGFSRADLTNPLTAKFKVNNIEPGNSTVGNAVDATASNSSFPGIDQIVSCLYTAPAKIPSGQNPVVLSTTVNYISQAVINGPPPTYRERILTYLVKIVDANVYRLDIVDWDGIATDKIDYYDSADIFIRVGPDNISHYTVPVDSIENFPPFAYPSSATGSDGCSYTWIPEPIGTVNVTDASVSYTQMGNDNYFVIINCAEANGNLPWFTIACPNAGTTDEHKDPSIPANLQFPVFLNTDNTSYDSLLTGTALKTHIRLTLVSPQ
jgi:hypothetical protein